MAISHGQDTYDEVAKFLDEVCSVYIHIRIVRIPQKAPGDFHVWKLVNIVIPKNVRGTTPGNSK